MKKLGRATFLIILIIILICIFAACNQSGDNKNVTPDDPQPTTPDDPQPATPDDPQPTTPDDPQPSSNVVTVHPNNGEKAFVWRISDEIPIIEREGYYFDGIYLDSIFTSATSFKSLKSTGFNGNIDVYVKWTSHKHEYGAWHILIEPTHISEGLRVWYCSLCNAEKYENMQTIGEHLYSDVWTIDIEPTTSTTGEKSHHCIIPGCVERKDITIIPKKDSDETDVPIEHTHKMVLIKKVPATCTVDGYEIRKCEECDYEERTTLHIGEGNAKHKELLAGEKCDVCEYVSISNLRDSVLMYNPSYDTYCAEYYGEVVEKDIFEFYNQRINLAYINNTIQTISQDSFKQWVSLDHIILPNSVTKIESSAFYGCSSLKSISIPNSVDDIEEEAFAQCIDLEQIEMSQSLKHIGRNVLYGTKWLNQQGEGQVYLGNVAIAIKQGCNKIDEIKPGTRIVADGFFANQSELSIITIPSSILYFGEKIFENCANITGVFYNAVNAECKDNLFMNITSIEHIVFGKDVEIVPNGLFENCSSIKDVTFVGENVSEIGANAFANCSALKDIVIPTGVTSIGDGAFDGCALLSRIEIPDSVTNIGVGAVNGCSSLESITIPFVGASPTASNGYDEVFGYIFGYTTTSASYSTVSGATRQYSEDSSYYWYYIPSSLKSVVISDKVTTIPSYAFYNCTGLTSVTIGNGVTSIGNSVFYNCSGLTSVTIGNGVTSIGNSVFYNCSGLTSITIPDGVTSIGSYAFRGCTGLTRITIPDSVTNIGVGAVNGCSSLESITIPFVGASPTASNGYDEVFGYIFGYTTTSASYSTVSGATRQYSEDSSYYWYYIPSSLKSVVISDKVTTIPSYAFYNCTGLTSVTIGNGVTSIGNSVFYNCTGLTSITIGSGVTSIGNEAFKECTGLTDIYYNGDVASWCGISGLGNLMSISRTLYIGGNKVEGELIIPDSITAIPSSAFEGCAGLTSIVIHDSVTSIGSSAFYNCKGLKSITIPDSVTRIDSYAFNGCSGLTSVYYKGTKSKWNKISIGNYNYDLTSTTRYYYSETEPPLNSNGTAYDDNYWHYDADGKTIVIWKKANEDE